MSVFLHKIKFIPKYFIIIVIVLVAARISLPYTMKWYINKTLHSMPGYDGYITKVHISLWKGAYRIEGLNTVKIQDNKRLPFLSSEQIEIALQWHALLKGRIVAKINLIHPEFQLFESLKKEKDPLPNKEPWQQEVKKLVPILINQFSIKGGVIRYINDYSKPKINIYVQNLNLLAENLSNVTKSNERLPSTIHLNALLLKSGNAQLDIKLNPFSEPIEADIKSYVRGLKLQELNNLTQVYGDFDFKDGFFDGTVELALTKTRYDGYFKTLFKKVKILDWEKERKKGASIGHLLWEGLLDTVVYIFKNGKKDQFAGRIPITGSRTEMEEHKWETFVSILRNGFVEPLSGKFENSVKFSEVVKHPFHKKKLEK